MNQEQFELSIELLYLLYWLIEHDPTSLKKLVDHAVKHNFKSEVEALLKSHSDDINASFEELQGSVGEFLHFADALLFESMQEHTMKQAVQKKLLPALEHIDSSICDQEIVADSVERATHNLNESNQDNTQELVLKELLKQWQPDKKTAIN